MRFDARKVLALCLLGVVLLLVPALAVRLTLRHLEELDSSAVRDAVMGSHDRVRASFASQFDDVARTLEDWSAWDAMYTFAKDPTDAKWREENFAPDSVASLGLSRIALFDINGKHVLHSDYDHAKGEAADFPIGTSEDEIMTGLGVESDLSTTRGGLCRGPDGTVSWTAVKPIRQSDKSGPIVGFLMMVRPLNDEILHRVQTNTGTDIRVAAAQEEMPGGQAIDDAGRCGSTFALQAWDGRDLGTLVISTSVHSVLHRQQALREFLLRSGIVAYVLLSSAALLTISAVWSRKSDRTSVAHVSGRLPVALAAAAGISLTAAGMWGVQNWQNQVHRQEFSRRSGNFSEQVDRELTKRREFIRFVQSYFHSSDAIEQNEFDRLIANGELSLPGTKLWAWLPGEGQAPDDRSGTSSEETPGSATSAATLPAAVAGDPPIPPVVEVRAQLLVNPASATEELTGRLSEWPMLQQHIDDARDTGDIVAVLMPVDDAGAGAGHSVALIAPVYGTTIDALMEHRRQEFRGVLICVVELGEIVNSSLRDLDYGGLTMSIVAVSSRPNIPLPVDDEADGRLTRRCAAPIARDLSVDLCITTDSRFSYGLQSAVSMGVAAVGVLLTCLLCAFIELNLQRTRRIEHLVTLRTAELEQKTAELTAANEAAQAAHQTKSAFLANMSHELRTPMTAILGYTDLLSEVQHAPDARDEFVRTIRRSAEHLLTLINDVLDLSKIEAGRMLVETLPNETTHLLHDVVMLLRERAMRKGLLLATEFVGNVPVTIRTDPTRFRQILVNLVGNAIKFTESGGVRIIVRLATAVDDPDPLLAMEVIDSGPGIDDAVMSRLFQPFEQGDGSMSRRYGGTGLGLSISRQLAEMLGGTIEAHSIPGEGTTFRVTIRTGALDGAAMLQTPFQTSLDQTGQLGPASPTASGGSPEAPSTEASAPQIAGEIKTGTAARILLAEDTIDNQRLLSFFLRKVTQDIVIVQNGREAVIAALEARSEGKPFDVVLMDIQMPVLDGFAATRALRESGYDRPIVALTAHASPADRQRCFDAGCDGFLTKPVDRNELIRVCRQFVEARASQSPPAAAA